MVIEKNIRKHDFLRGGPKWVIIYGTKGEGFNPGYVWASYIMSVDPAVDEFQPRQGITSTYSITTVNNRYYSTITL